MKKIGILTLSASDNCGSLLQAYALQTVLQDRGYDVEIIDFTTPISEKMYRIFHPGYISSPKMFFGQIIRYKDLIKQKRDYQQFRQERLRLTEQRYSSIDGLRTIDGKYEAIVCGSDQIWNPEITEGFQDGYFCAFPKKGGTEIRCVAYAASIGSERLEEKYEKAFSRLLSNFDAVSLREPCSAAFVGRLYGKEIQTVLDPVFLLEREEWEAFLKNLPGKKCSDRKRKYIALYYTEYNPSMAGYLERLEERTGLGTLILKPQRQMHVWSRGAEYAVCHDPLEFLHGLFHAEYVVTNSFHGTAMSILFHKKFAVFSHQTRGARIRDVLKAAHLENRLAQEARDADRMEERIDWDEVDRALEIPKRESVKFIRESILGT